MNGTDRAMVLMTAADPAHNLHADPEQIERALERVLASIAQDQQPNQPQTQALPNAKPPRRAHLRALALALLGLLALTAAALAATGAFRTGTAVHNPNPLIGHQGHDLGHVERTRLLPVSTPDPAGGPPWGLRIAYTSRDVGCLEVGRLLDQRLGVLGIEGGFKDDRRFHELQPGQLSGPAACTNLDARGRLFETAAKRALPAAGAGLSQVCLPTPNAADGYRQLPAGGICPSGGVRQVYFGTLGPLARWVIYHAEGKSHRLATHPPDGAYLIVLPAPPSFLRHDPFGPGTITSQLPSPWTSPITAVVYQDGSVCHIAARRPGVLVEHCPLRGYTARHTTPATPANVASPLHITVVHGEHHRRELEVSFTARLPVTAAQQDYQLVEDTSSPLAVFNATKRNIRAGERVSFHVWAIAPGTYSGKVTYTEQAPADYPTYLYGPGPLVGRFHITLP